MNEIKIDQIGKITDGDYKNWYLLIQDKENTGGYLILLFNNFDRFKSTEGCDYWAEDFSSLEQMFKEADWKVEWLK